MIISSRAKSKMNYLQNSSQLCLLRKYIFASLMSCDTNLIKTNFCFINKSCADDHVMKKHEKCTYEASIIVTSFEDNSFLTSLGTR
jgi:hypothetical protein